LTTVAEEKGADETTVWLARHGEVHNPTGMLYGRLPRMGLSDEGRRQAMALGEFLRERPLGAIYASPMLRARQTAAAIQAEHPELRVRRDSRLTEIRSGWEGRPRAELDAIGWDYYEHPFQPGDDGIEDIRQRMRGWLNAVLKRHPGGEIVGVSHGDPMLILVSALRGDPPELSYIRPRPYISTACVFKLRFDLDGDYLGADLFVPHARD